MAAVGFLRSNCSSGTARASNSESRFSAGRQMSVLARGRRFFDISGQDARDVESCLRVVEAFRPDVVHVFGTESPFGLVAGHADIPVVIHLQGLLGPYLNAWVPPGCRMLDYAIRGKLNPVKIAAGVRALAFNRHAAERELKIMRQCRHFLGRTEWDKAFVAAHAPGARYDTVWETLRGCFYDGREWTRPSSAVLVSTVSAPLYKGHDMILKTAKALRDSGFADFTWRVFGIGDLRFAERTTGIRAADVGVAAEGVATAEYLCKALSEASVYVHPSYIDNSPNSVCEAQVLGVPVVATAVGGVPSLFSADRVRCLVPANDPLMAAARIREAVETPEAYVSDRKACLARHDPAAIADRLEEIWRSAASDLEGN